MIHTFNAWRAGSTPAAALVADGSGALYGTASLGGTNNNGTIFKLTPPAAGQTAWTRTTLFSFDAATTGERPQDTLVMDSQGALYGSTYYGGAGCGCGVVFKLTPPAAGGSAWQYTILHTFRGKADGAHPGGTLYLDAQGNLYGVASESAKKSTGIFYELSPPGAGVTGWHETVLYTFNGPTDGAPNGGVIAGPGGSFYGTFAAGGSQSQGAVFQLTPPPAGQTGWSESLLFSFGGTNGAYLPGGLIADSSGALYGVANRGGAGGGVVFMLSPPASGQTAWTESVLYSFKIGADGGLPYGPLLRDASGTLYGTTFLGGAKQAGVVYALSPPAGGTSWTETVLHSFGLAGDGFGPTAALVAGTGGTLFGTTTATVAPPSPRSDGVVFKLTPPSAGQGWSESVLTSFVDNADGSAPLDGPIADGAGALYGTTENGGLAGNGLAYKLTPPAAGHTAWSESELHSFAGGLDGANPEGALVADASGALYGTTRKGGNGKGTLFQLVPPAAGQTGWSEHVLHRFQGGPDGAYPTSALIRDAAGSLYGTAPEGGRGCQPNGCGIVFQATPPISGSGGWTWTKLYKFRGGTDGANPYGALVADASGTLYGTTANGGAHKSGTVFALTPPPAGQTAWTETVLYSFGAVLSGDTAEDGAVPYAGLAFGTGGVLYGTTTFGGSNNAGVVFQLAPPAGGQGAWAETVLASFTDGGGFAAPEAGVIVGPGGVLYGTATGAPEDNGGYVYSLTPPATGQTAWTRTILHTFALNSAGGSTPRGGLLRDASGNLFGVTQGGEPTGDGTVFELTP